MNEEKNNEDQVERKGEVKDNSGEGSPGNTDLSSYKPSRPGGPNHCGKRQQP